MRVARQLRAWRSRSSHPVLGSELPHKCATSDALFSCLEHQGRDSVFAGSLLPRNPCATVGSCVEGQASTTRGHGVLLLGDLVSDHRVRDGEQLAHNRGEHPLSGLAAPAQTGAGSADGRTVEGSHGDHAGKRASRGATAPGTALVPTAVPVQGNTPTRAAISYLLRRLTSDNSDMSTAATTGPTQGMLRSCSAQD